MEAAVEEEGVQGARAHAFCGSLAHLMTELSAVVSSTVARSPPPTVAGLPPLFFSSSALLDCDFSSCQHSGGNERERREEVDGGG
jgi:hypothetical protein